MTLFKQHINSNTHTSCFSLYSLSIIINLREKILKKHRLNVLSFSLVKKRQQLQQIIFAASSPVLRPHVYFMNVFVVSGLSCFESGVLAEHPKMKCKHVTVINSGESKRLKIRCRCRESVSRQTFQAFVAGFHKRISQEAVQCLLPVVR